MEPRKIGEFLKSLRRHAGYTQAELGNLIDVTDKAISRWESGNGFPELSNLLALSELYGISADDILHCNENALSKIKRNSSAEHVQAQTETIVPDKAKPFNVSQKFLTVIFFAYISLGVYIASWSDADTDKFIPSFIIYMALAVLAVACEIVSAFIPYKITAIARVSLSSAFLANSTVLLALQFAFAYSDGFEVPRASVALLLVFVTYVLYALYDFFNKKILKRIFSLSAAAASLAITIYCAVVAAKMLFDGYYDDIYLNIARGLIGTGCTVVFFAAAQLFGNRLCAISAITAVATAIVCITIGKPLYDSPFLQYGPLPASLWIGIATIAPAMILFSYALENSESQYTIRRTFSLLAFTICMPLTVNSFDVLLLNNALGIPFYSVQVLLKIFALLAFMLSTIEYFDIKGAIEYFIYRGRKNEKD